MNIDSIKKIGAQAEKQKVFAEKLKKASSNVKEDVSITVEKILGGLAYDFRVLCERNYFDKYNTESYVDFLEKEIVCLKLLKEDVINNEGIL